MLGASQAAANTSALCSPAARPLLATFGAARAALHGAFAMPRRQAVQQPCRKGLVCRAAGFSGSSSGSSSKDEVPLPNSRDEAVRQAASAIAAQLTAGGKGSKGFAGGGNRKITVDVPVLEQSGAAMVQLAADIISQLPKPLRQTCTIVACSSDAGALPASAGGTRVVSLAECVAAGEDLEGCLMIAGPSTEQLNDVMRVLAYWRGPGAVALNADWAAESAPVEQVAFIKSFEAVYCFLPLVVKVLFIGQEGAVFKWVTGGSPAATPWRIFGKDGQRLAPIGRMQHRPSNADLETVFYNAYAANNPLNKGIKALRGMVGGGGKDT